MMKHSIKHKKEKKRIWVKPSIIGGNRKKNISVNLFIRDYLNNQGEDYTYNIYRAYKKKMLNFGRENKKKYHIGSYNSFCRYFWILEKLGLVVKSKTKKSTKFPYRVSSDGIPVIWATQVWKLKGSGLEEEWSNPYKAYIRGKQKEGFYPNVKLDVFGIKKRRKNDR